MLDGKQNQRTLSYLPIQNINELSEPGLYFAVMKRAGTFHDQFETSFFFVSDIGLHTRVYHDKLWLHTASLKSGDAHRPASTCRSSTAAATRSRRQRPTATATH